jgi:16S rRNA (cytidine1402-2'-O)-methyltransferase
MTNKHVPDNQNKTGTLFVVATPIGNLEDITFRAVKVLKMVNSIACEDTRHTRKLLSHFGINCNLISYYQECEQQKSEKIINLLKNGDDIALVSDAGTPAISDPGAILTRKARDAGISIIAIPGPSSVTTALSICGFQSSKFIFMGFAPSKSGQRNNFFKSMLTENRPFVFFESPRRIIESLKTCEQFLGDRDFFIARELTKLHETIYHGKIDQIISELKKFTKVKGEFVVIVNKNNSTPEPDSGELEDLLKWYKDELKTSLSEAVKKIARDLGLPRGEVYKKALQIWDD